MVNAISPNVYVRINDLVSYVQEIPGTVGFHVFLSERGEDNKLIFASNFALSSVFGQKDLKKYGQGLFNAENYQRYSTWLYVLRVLPNIEDNAELDTPYVHPLAGQVIHKIGSTAPVDDTTDVNEGRAVQIPSEALEPPATFSHATVGYVYDSTNDKYGLFIRYKKPFGNEQTPYIHLDEDYGVVTRSYAYTVYDNEQYEEYNKTRTRVNDNVFETTLMSPSVWQKLDIGSASTGGILENSNGFVEKYWNATEDDYYTGFTPDSDSFVPLFTVFGIGRSPWYDNLRFTFTKVPGKPGFYYFHVLSYNAGTDSYVELDAPYEISFDPTATDDQGESLFFSDVVNQWSDHVRIAVSPENLDTARKTSIFLDNAHVQRGSVLDKILSPFYEYTGADRLSTRPRLYAELREGSFGVLYNRDGSKKNDILIKILTEAYKGSHDSAILNPFENEITITFDADYPTPVKEAIQSFCDIRCDVFGVLDMKRVASVSDAVSLRNTEYSGIGSFRVALYAPHAKVGENGKEIVVAPSYFASYIYPRTDLNYALWVPPAGLVNGSIEEKAELDFNVGLSSENDRLTLSQINALKKEFGIVHFGNQITALRVPGALTNINVARLVLYIAKTLRKAGKFYLFRVPVTPEGLSLIKKDFEDFLREIKLGGGIQNMSVNVSSTPYETKRKIAKAVIQIVPTYYLEKLFIDINITE